MNTEAAALRRKLEAELKRIKRQQAEIDGQLSDRPRFGLGQGDPRAATWEMNLTRQRQLVEKVNVLREALSRLDAGTYGVCEICGGQIDPERLEILPSTSVCAGCAGAQAETVA